MAKKKRNGILKNRFGLSPVIMSVLLIAMTLAISSIVFLWFRGMVEEGVTKFGKNIKLVCEDVDFEASYSDGVMSVINNGNVPIFRLNLKISENGNYQTEDITDVSDEWPEKGLNQGAAFSGEVDIEDATKITVYPILIGTSGSGKKTFVCGGNYGKEIEI